MTYSEIMLKVLRETLGDAAGEDVLLRARLLSPIATELDRHVPDDEAADWEAGFREDVQYCLRAPAQVMEDMRRENEEFYQRQAGMN